jgi:carbonic anhydrase/acetyltransferase-like protein (isoleucine patch superfamily)
MNAVIMDDVMIGKESIVGALCFVPANTQIPFEHSSPDEQLVTELHSKQESTS